MQRGLKDLQLGWVSPCEKCFAKTWHAMKIKSGCTYVEWVILSVFSSENMFMRDGISMNIPESLRTFKTDGGPEILEEAEIAKQTENWDYLNFLKLQKIYAKR